MQIYVLYANFAIVSKSNIMNKEKLQQRKQFRDIIYKADPPPADYLWNFSVVIDYCMKRYDLRESQIKLMLFVYSMESFLFKPMAQKMNRNPIKLWEKVARDLVERDFIKEELYSKGYKKEFYETYEPHTTTPGVMSRRWALSTKGRQFVSKFYQYLEGTRAMNPDVL